MLSIAWATPVPVEVVATADGFELHRGGAPYTLRGAGGADHLDTLVQAGGTSLRTWGVGAQTGELLDAAHARGLTVTLGIWLAHERHGFDYGDATQVSDQLAQAREAVSRFKDHPALLMWGVGNEMEGFEAGDNPKIWSAVCDVAAMVQQLDPHHPVMTTTADIGGGRVAGVMGCDAIDVHGINSYGGAPSAAERYRAAGGTKPVVLTEYGPPGVWEIPTTPFGAYPELTSTDKATIYGDVARRLDADPHVLGGYAFLWGFKTEATATWYGLFLPDGTRLGGVDALADTWGGKLANRAPVSKTGLLSNVGDEVRPGQVVRVSWDVSDPEDKPLSTTWSLRREIVEQSTGGDPQGLPPVLTGVVLSSDATGAVLRMPKSNGVMRLYAVARDPDGAGATASLPILVGEPLEPDSPLPVPWWVYQDDGVGGPWVPTGWMGRTDSITVDTGWSRDCHGGASCIRATGSVTDWTGVAWQTPANNWGDQPGGRDLSGAKVLTFWARSEFDGVSATFGVGMIDDKQPHPDSLRAETEVVLTSTWRRYRIPLRGDRRHLITGFWWVMGAQVNPTIFLDDIVFE